jgi:phosphoenolpyruvate synthase/pyruvate phosphate dikinase|tara:strand:- start:249 stop:434 length:186 start_codon:yes stop_codon:yes gene_type:complete
MQSKWHNISIKTESFEQLQEIQKQIPIRVSIPQTIEWLIKVGQKQINQSGDINENTSRIPK